MRYLHPLAQWGLLALLVAGGFCMRGGFPAPVLSGTEHTSGILRRYQESAATAPMPNMAGNGIERPLLIRCENTISPQYYSILRTFCGAVALPDAGHLIGRVNSQRGTFVIDVVLHADLFPFYAHFLFTPGGIDIVFGRFLDNRLRTLKTDVCCHGLTGWRYHC